jgi:hypothetical protein
VQESVSFGFSIGPDFPVVHYLAPGEAPPAECPGSTTNPQALPGHLCLYASLVQNVSEVCVFNPNNDNCAQTSLRGFGVAITSAGAGGYWAQGSWAVTAK